MPPVPRTVDSSFMSHDEGRDFESNQWQKESMSHHNWGITFKILSILVERTHTESHTPPSWAITMVTSSLAIAELCTCDFITFDIMNEETWLSMSRAVFLVNKAANLKPSPMKVMDPHWWKTMRKCQFERRYESSLPIRHNPPRPESLLFLWLTLFPNLILMCVWVTLKKCILQQINLNKGHKQCTHTHKLGTLEAETV